VEALATAEEERGGAVAGTKERGIAEDANLAAGEEVRGGRMRGPRERAEDSEASGGDWDVVARPSLALHPAAGRWEGASLSNSLAGVAGEGALDRAGPAEECQVVSPAGSAA
jgi:hypothetical protein